MRRTSVTRVCASIARIRAETVCWQAQQARPGRPAIVGTPGEVAGMVARYQEAGADELIVPEDTLGPTARKKDTCDLFMQEVAPAFR